MSGSEFHDYSGARSKVNSPLSVGTAYVYVEPHRKTRVCTRPQLCGRLYSRRPLKQIQCSYMKQPGGLSLLIVEDNAAVRQLIKSVVSDLADTIYECADGVEAIATYSRFRPDFVLMDIRMTVMDGISAARQITKANPGAKIVMVTDYDEIDLRESAKHAGAIGYVLKDNLLELGSFLKAQPRSQKSADR